ncbi:MAG: sensor histidine kinase [Granulosicoccaceae bacterium]
MPLVANSSAIQVQLSQRLRSLLFVIVCVVFCVWAFGGAFLSNSLEPTAGLSKLPVTLVDTLSGSEQRVDVPNTWFGGDKPKQRERRYRVRLPAGVDLRDQVLYITAFRQSVTVRLQGRVIARAGNQKIVWLEPYLQPLHIPLESFAEFASKTEPSVVDIEVLASESNSGGLSEVWFGSSPTVAKAQPLYVSAMPVVLHANIGILSALILFLAIDSIRSMESRLRLLLAVPHLFYALCCLPEIHFLSSTTWLKLYQVSINSMVLMWIYVGFYALGLFRSWLSIPIVGLVLMSVPYLFISDYDLLSTWIYQIQNPIMGVLGVFIFLYFGWRLPDSNNQVIHAIFLIAGACLSGAGINDISLNLSDNRELQLLVLPVAAALTSVVLLLWTSLDMLQRNIKISKQQEHLQKLISTRTNALEEARSKLMQHQRYQTLNTMGAAISHEIKNPLASLNTDLSLLDLKLKKIPDIDVPVKRMLRTLKRIDNTVSDLTDFSRRQSIERKVVDLSAWLNQLSVGDEIQTLLSGVSFHLEIFGNVEARIDKELVRRAIVNILNNAVYELRDHAEPEIWLRVHSLDEDKVVISIVDNGDGFKVDDFEALFEPLVSSNDSGLGLGLAIVRDIMLLHLGEVILDSDSHEGGAVVSLVFPKA